MNAHIIALRRKIAIFLLKTIASMRMNWIAKQADPR